jgi:lysozyme
VSRFTPAPGSKTRVAAGGVVIALASVGMVATIKHDEGREYKPYRDIVGVLTVCDGITGPDVIPGKTYTDQECNALTIKHLESHGSQLLDCVHVRITQQMYEALANWAYNVGVGAACKSTAIRLINAGQYETGCRDLMRWNKAGGQVVRGLTLRREREMQGCLDGIPSKVTYQRGFA